MDKEIILSKINTLGQSFNGDYTRATLCEFVYKTIVELTEMLKTFKKENPTDALNYDALSSTAINGFELVFSHWVKANQEMPETMVLPLGDFEFGNCLLDAWMASVRKMQELELDEKCQNKLKELYSGMDTFKSNNGGDDNGGCFGVLILLIAGAASVIGASCWGISHLLAI